MKAVKDVSNEEKNNSMAFYVFSGLMILGFGVLIGAVIYLYLA